MKNLTVALCWLGVGCSGGASGPPLEPPPDTGDVVIEMVGDWVVTAVEVLEQVGGSATPPSPPTRLYPPVVGSAFRIGPDGFVDLDGAGTATMCEPGEFVERFAWMNHQDGRFAWVDIGCRSRPDPRIADGGSSRVQCVFGSVDADRMVGYVRVEIDAAPVPAELVRLGLYRVAIVRM